jgi:hypothetical protein
MSWHRSRLSILVLLALLYTAPLSSGDKGLWLSLAPLPVQLLGAVPSGTPPEHEILLPDHGALLPEMLRVVEEDLSSDPVAATARTTSFVLTSWQRHRDPQRSAALGAMVQALTVPRGPPA